jgi:ABC-2 type transport system permease protein
MAKKLRILWTLFRCRVSRNMMYRLSFWTAFWIDLIVFLIQLAAFSVIFGQVESIGGWTLPHMVIFVGTFTMLDSLYMCTYFFGVLAIPDKIRNGSLDLYLTRPVNTLFMLSVEAMDFGSILLTVPGMLMIGWGMGQLGIRLSLGLLAGFLVLFGMMFLLMYCLMVLLRTPAFWLVRANAFNELENTFVDFSYRIPGIAFQGVWKVLLYMVLPYGLMATLPTQFLTGGMHWYHWLLAAGVLAGFWIMMQLFWRAGLRRYGSASS